MANFRAETRKERYNNKADQAVIMPVSLATVSFQCEGNVGFTARSVGCFGGEGLHVIGALPEYAELRRLSGGVSNFIEIYEHSNPIDFVSHCRDNDLRIVCAELDPSAVNIHDYSFDFTERTVIVLGHEQVGIPVEISKNAQDFVYVPMPGVGYCLNTSQTGNILLYEAARQFKDW